MSAADLAALMGVTQSTVARLEASERQGRIQLDSLQRAADALGCDVAYVLVPRKPLEALVEEQAKRLAAAHMRSLGHTMALEDQALSDDQIRQKFDLLVEHYKTAHDLWRHQPLDS